MSKRRFSGAFATTKSEDGCGIWGWMIKELDTPEPEILKGSEIDDFIATLWDDPTIQVVYLHGLKYYAYFLISFLLESGEFKYVRSAPEARDMTFTAMIMPGGDFFAIDIYFEVKEDKSGHRKVHKVTFRDTEKLIKMGAWELSAAFKLDKILVDDYLMEDKPYPYEPTEEEFKELEIRCDIVDNVLAAVHRKQIFSNTLAAGALRSYREHYQRDFAKLFPLISPEIDWALRQAYVGGFNYLNPDYRGKETGPGVMIDVNSMYPYVLSSASGCKLPVGDPVFFTGKYPKNTACPLYVQHFSCAFKLKENHIPTIRMKNYGDFNPQEYVTDSHGNTWELTMAMPDLKLFLENYDVMHMNWIDGYMFKTKDGLFDDFIYTWIDIKNKAKKDKDTVSEYLAKSVLNMLGGKFAAFTNGHKMEPYLDEDKCLCFQEYRGDPADPVYCPIAIFMNSWARYFLIRMSQKITKWGIEAKGFNPVVYHDTDCIAVLASEEELKKNIKDLRIDDYKLGAFKVENRFERAKWLRQKTYCLDLGCDNIKITAAGLPSAIVPYITYDDFMTGFTTEKMDEALKRPLYRAVPGGCVIDHTEYTF